MRTISLIKFKEGGAAKFKIRNINHQRESFGEVVRKPFIKNKFRL